MYRYRPCKWQAQVLKFPKGQPKFTCVEEMIQKLPNIDTSDDCSIFLPQLQTIHSQYCVLNYQINIRTLALFRIFSIQKFHLNVTLNGKDRINAQHSTSQCIHSICEPLAEFTESSLNAGKRLYTHKSNIYRTLVQIRYGLHIRTSRTFYHFCVAATNAIDDA